jgi:hypothetical protein
VGSDFNEWMEQLRSLAVEEFGYSLKAAQQMDETAYRESWEDGEDPRSTLIEEAYSE